MPETVQRLFPERQRPHRISRQLQALRIKETDEGRQRPRRAETTMGAPALPKESLNRRRRQMVNVQPIDVQPRRPLRKKPSRGFRTLVFRICRPLTDLDLVQAHHSRGGVVVPLAV